MGHEKLCDLDFAVGCAAISRALGVLGAKIQLRDGRGVGLGKAGADFDSHFDKKESRGGHRHGERQRLGLLLALKEEPRKNFFFDRNGHALAVPAAVHQRSPRLQHGPAAPVQES